MKIGILGGSFAPIHNGHMHIARMALEKASLDQVWLMPSGMAPHKDIAQSATRFHRYEMVSLAAGEYDRIIPFSYEIKKDERCYTYKTMEELAEIYPYHDFYFIIGEDSVDLFPQWKHPERITAVASLLIAARPGSLEGELLKKGEAIADRFNCHVQVISTDSMDISSTDIRDRLEKGKDVSGLLPQSVLKYIREHHLYESRQNSYDEDFLEDIRKRIKDVLPKKRYRHSLGVAEAAGALAMRYGIEPSLAICGGLLHDCTKYLKGDDQIAYCKKHHISITDFERKAPWLIHAISGEYEAAHKYDISDPEVLSAIRWHTTGRADMTILEKIIFCADYIEKGRDKAVRLPEIRQAAFIDIDMAVGMILADTISYLNESGSPIDPASKQAYEFYRKTH